MAEVSSGSDAGTSMLPESVEAWKDLLRQRDDEIEGFKKELQKCKRLLDKTVAYNKDLRKQVEKLSDDLINQRSARNQKTIAVQANPNEIDDAFTNGDWLVASEKANLSVADCVREAAEQVTRQSGYVFDEASGYYYDSTSGYYYDAEQSLYYDAKTGIYFYYNEETKKYEFHSQIDVSQFKTDQQEADTKADQLGDLKTKSKSRKNSKNDDPGKSNRRPDRCPKKLKISDVYDSDIQIDNEEEEDLEDEAHVRVKYKKQKGKSSKAETRMIIESVSSEHDSVEEGECSDSSDEKYDKYRRVEDSNYDDSNEAMQECGSQWPPCIRVIVVETDVSRLTVGTLFLVTCKGAAIGREKSCDIYLPDIEVSKAHAEFSFSEACNFYMVQDIGSQNGTYLNGVRLSESKQTSEQQAVKHDDVIEVGKTKLLLHIHKGLETCDNCEPGQVQAVYAAQNPNRKEIRILSKEEKEQERKQALKQIKKKFGLEATAYEDKVVDGTSAGYKDRAKERRHTKGSDNPYEKTETASVDKAISVENKGFKMMQKMGWESGQTLGKSQAGLVEPIPMEGQVSKAGFGSGASGIAMATTSDPKELKRKEKWKRARERYHNIDRQPPQQQQRQLRQSSSSPTQLPNFDETDIM